MAFCPKGRYYDETRFPHCEGCDCGLAAPGGGQGAPGQAAATVYKPGAEPAGAGGPPGPAQRPPWMAPPPVPQMGRPNPAGPSPFAGGASGTVYSEATEAERLMGFLLVVSSRDDEGRYFRLTKGVNPLGKFETGCAVGLRDQEASAGHALVVCTNTAARLVDLDSTNGTYVNGARTEYAELTEGDVVTVGRTHLAYVPFAYIAED